MIDSGAVLLLDTTGADCRVGLWYRGNMAVDINDTPQGHAQNVLPMIDALIVDNHLTRQDIVGIVYTQGPGAFTGVRIGVSVVQGLALALSVPTIGVSSLLALAWQAAEPSLANNPKVLACIDARMSQVYWAVYAFSACGEVQVLRPDSVGLPTPEIDFDVSIGDGLIIFSPEVVIDKRNHRVDLEALMRFTSLGLSNKSMAWSEALALPVYLRNDVALKSMKQK
jgi:tRNA threonylcarbamoyladenosine biosynthesis protein TsaB